MKSFPRFFIVVGFIAILAIAAVLWLQRSVEVQPGSDVQSSHQDTSPAEVRLGLASDQPIAAPPLPTPASPSGEPAALASEAPVALPLGRAAHPEPASASGAARQLPSESGLPIEPPK